MSVRKSYIVITAVLVLMFISAAGFSKKNTAQPSQPNQAGPQGSASSSGSAVGQKVLSFNLEGLNDRGSKTWEVNGESAEAISETQVKLDNIVAKAYGEESEATITADKGVYDKTKNNVRLEQNVRATIINKQGSKGGYNEVAGQVASKADQSAEKGGKAAPKKSSTITITCDGEVQFDYVHNLAYFEKNVKVVSDDGTIDADKITVNLDPSSKKMTDIVAEGNVKIVRGENITYSSKATYVDADKKVVLTGKPKIILSQEGGEGTMNLLGK
jgi:lipopolysaccharide assembly outer membrane protein LptD (OstA)